MNLGTHATLDLTSHWAGLASLAVFVTAYALVLSEEFTHLRKSKPVMLAAGIIWGMIALAYSGSGDGTQVHDAVIATLSEYAELLLFLLAAMSYVNAMTERNVFGALRSWLVRRGFGYRQLFWITGILGFFLSPVIDNLTTALVLAAVVVTIGTGNPRFTGIACVNIVVAVNAGGAFSPFGDLTTLMVWQAGHARFGDFFALFLPSVVNYMVPAVIMHFSVPSGSPRIDEREQTLKRGARRIMVLFVLTLITAVSFHNFLHLPPFLGMMTGLAYLKLFGYYLKVTSIGHYSRSRPELGDVPPFDIFRFVAQAEWDTLLFFYGVIFCVGGLGFAGYLELVSAYTYGELGPTYANVLVGILSAIVDNIPVVVAVLHMAPDMPVSQWLLVTLTAGVGGSLLSIGSAAGVALMGQSRGAYTFFSHLRWTPAIAAGFAASIATHLWLQ